MDNAQGLAAAPDAPVLGQALPVELMNTIWADRRGRYDSLAAPADARAWARAISARLDPAVRPAAEALPPPAARMLRDLRDAARHLAALVTHDPRPAVAPDPWPAGPRVSPRDERDASASAAAAAETVNRYAALAPSWPALVPSAPGALGRELVSAGSAADMLVALLAAECVVFLADAEQAGLRACLAPGCVLYFVKDHPRREWCSTACGNRARAARHYSRHGRTSTEPSA